MRILQIIPNLSGGGAQRLVLDLCNEMSKEHQVALLTLYDDNNGKELFRQYLNKDVKTFSLGKKLGFDLKIFSRLYKCIRQFNPEIVQTHTNGVNYVLPITFFFQDIHFFHTLHNDAFEECKSRNIRNLRKFFFKRKKIYPITISKNSDSSFQEFYGNIQRTMIYNGRVFPEKSEDYQKAVSEIESYKRTERTKIFTNVGYIDPQKNQNMLVDAFAKMTSELNADAVLLIIGRLGIKPGAEDIYRYLENIVIENKSIKLLGEKKNVTDYLLQSDFFCLSSTFEGMPISLIEAFATGTIPICTPVGGVTEMVSDIDASLLSDTVKRDDYFQVLKRAYLLSEESQNVLRQKTLTVFNEKYSIAKCVENHISLFNKFINK